MTLYLPSVVVPNGKNLSNLIAAFKADPYSRYQGLTYCTRQNLDRLLRRLVREHGHEIIGEIKPWQVMDWHRAWLGDDEDKPKITMAHSLIQALRSVVYFGATMHQVPECIALKATLGGLRFPVGKSNGVAMTTEQAVAFILMAHEMDYPSMALCQSIQSSTGFRQKDLIGEYVPNTERVKPLMVYGDRFWLRGMIWPEVGTNLKLRHTTSKKQKPAVFDLTLAPLFQSQIQHIKQEQVLARGPIIIREGTDMPWPSSDFRRVWREIADAAGLPQDVTNSRSRSGMITEAINLNAPKDKVRMSAQHEKDEMTNRYAKGEEQAMADVAMIRAPAHEEIMKRMGLAA